VLVGDADVLSRVVLAIVEFDEADIASLVDPAN
jgi:hypothetical protein